MDLGARELRAMRGWVAGFACALLLAACGGGNSGMHAQREDLTVVQFNTLHGLSGQGCLATENCRLPDRIALLFQSLAHSGCPDIVTLQETWQGAGDSTTGSVPLMMQHLQNTCPFSYQLVQGRILLHRDDETVLTRYPVLETDQLTLEGNFRHVFWVRIDHPLGPIDVFTTHLASSSDGADTPCDAASHCSVDCLAAGAATRRDCQAVQVAAFVEARHDIDTPAVIAGDFNDSPGSFVYETFTGRDWKDAYLAAGNPECDPVTGAGCTSGRQDESLVDLESPASNEFERIDFVFLIPPRRGFPCRMRLDPAADRDGDGAATRLFPTGPEPGCGPAPAPICWPSDHMGVEIDLACR
jgi:endonuclease/exonuclease/phosphatase family metal-dependent hydrolase